jgi:simple sugar transport system permease protein
VTLWSLAFVAAILRISMPYVLAALGGTFSERAGVINIALEGLLIAGAFAATVAGQQGQSVLLGVAAGVAAGVAFAGLYALCVLRLSADQIVCGVALNLLADGLSRFLLKTLYGSSSNSPRVDAFGRLLHAGSPLVAALTHPLVWATVALVAASHLLFARTRFGLRLRAVGEHPEACASLGVSPRRVRLAAVLCAGALAGMGGAWMAIDQRQFVAGMTSGRGYIALAAMIFGGWRPAWAAAAGVLFGAAEALQIALSTAGVGLPDWLVQMVPYAVTVLVLSGLSRRARRAPAALGRPL